MSKRIEVWGDPDETILCPNCGGTGNDPETMICVLCGGEGVLRGDDDAVAEETDDAGA